MTDKPFDPTKPCKTRAGAPARIFDTKLRAREGILIVAAVDIGNGGEVVFTFQPDGKYLDDGRTSSNDLVNVPEKHVRWLNIYDTPDAKLYMTKEQADKLADDTRLARVRIEFEEGQFDE